MSKHSRRTVTTLAASVPLALAASLTLAPPALATQQASFTGLFDSTCTMPTGPEGPMSGPYHCDHIATSTACAATVTLENGAAQVYSCRANLLDGSYTNGWAELWPTNGGWACESGSGTGTVAYRPNFTDAHQHPGPPRPQPGTPVH